MSEVLPFLLGLSAVLAAVFVFLWRRRRPAAAPGKPEAWLLIDGSNVMHWQDNKPALEPLLAVVERLQDLGYVPGVVFDANAGWKLQGRYMDDGELAWFLGLEAQQVLVVPKGSQADPFLLETARDLNARIVTNDRYRDWSDKYPDVTQPDRLIRGDMRGGKLWLQGMTTEESTS